VAGAAPPFGAGGGGRWPWRLAVGRPPRRARAGPAVGAPRPALASRRTLQRTRRRQPAPARADYRGASRRGRASRRGNAHSSRDRRHRRDRSRRLCAAAWGCRRTLRMAAFIGLFRRDLSLALRQGGDTGPVLGFFVLAVLLF